MCLLNSRAQCSLAAWLHVPVLPAISDCAGAAVGSRLRAAGPEQRPLGRATFGRHRTKVVWELMAILQRAAVPDHLATLFRV